MPGLSESIQTRKAMQLQDSELCLLDSYLREEAPDSGLRPGAGLRPCFQQASNRRVRSLTDYSATKGRKPTKRLSTKAITK